METGRRNLDSKLSRDLGGLRLAIVLGGLLIALFMVGDLQLVPPELRPLYIQNRALLQLPLIALVLMLTFHSRFHDFSQWVFLIGVLGLTYINFGLIYLAWVNASFSFPYEGTLLYAFFGFFVLGMKFRFSVALMILSTLGFLALMSRHPVYGPYTFMNVGFVAGSLFIGVFARRRLDQTLAKLESANTKLTGLSNQDSLTGLLNRRAFKSESERVFDLTRRSNQTLSVFMMDLDHFKQFNDHYGHQAGDDLIHWHANLMQQVFQRKTDTLGRYGGEEFIAVVISQTLDDAEKQAMTILKAWDEKSRQQNDNPASALGCSIGICQGNAQSFDSLGNMIRLADEALYVAKETGRQRIVMATPHQPKEAWQVRSFFGHSRKDRV